MESRWALLLIFALLGRCRCHIHWMVTENGKIEYQDDTPYDLRKPYDLVGFMQQEERFNKLKDMEPLMSGYGQLLKQYDNGSPERTIRTTDPHCRASMPISGYDFHISSMLPIGTQNIYESYLSRYINFTPGTDKPYCHLSPLMFSMYTMDHLDSVQRRKELGTYKPELSMTSEVRHSMDDYGHFVSKAMEKNTTSWVLFNFAAIYWRYKGDATNVLECARRALHYSPMDQKDIGLLHMASVLQRMGLLDDAATLMEVAVTFNRANLLYHYILAGIYVTQNLFDKSLEHIEYVLTKEPSFKDGRSLWHAIYCEQRLHNSVSSYSEQYEEAKDGFNRYSATYSDLQKHQVIPSKFKIPGLDKLNMQSSDAHLPRIPKQQQKWSKESQAGSRKKDTAASGSSVLNQTAFTDAREAAMLSQTSNTSTKKVDPKETAPSNLTSHNVTNSTQPPGDNMASKDDMDKHVGIKDGEEKTDTKTSPKKPHGNKPRIIFHPEGECRRSSRPSSDEEDLGTNEEENIADEKELEQKASSNREEKSDKLPKQEATSPTLSESNQLPSTSRQSSDSTATGSQYTGTYQNSEFRPYNPLSHTLEERLFPRPFGPANFFDYPSWPDKTECLDVVENLSAWMKSSRMDIDMEKRGHNYEKMFLILSPNMPKRLMKTPHCYNIVELTYTMHAMDHLPAIAKRKLYNYNDESIAMQYQEFVQDKFMKHFAAKGATEVDEAGKLIYAALLKHGPNHALFSLAGFYWRIKGNVYQAIECYRRAAHFAPQLYKDIAYVALANVMLDVEALEEAVVFARAAVEIRPHELVSHYTYALTLSAIGELDGCSLHLRWVLMHDVKFPGALEYLKTVRCYVKFERERVELEKQHKQLLARQAALDKKREDLQKEFELILERADLLLDHDNVMQYIETLEEKRKEISALADIDNYEKMMFLQDNAYSGEDGSSTSKTKAVADTSCKDCEQFATVNTVTGDYIEHYSGQAAIQYFSSVVMFLRKKEETALQIRNSRREASAVHRKKLSLTTEEIDALKPVTQEQLDLLSFPDDEDCEDRLKTKYLPYASTWLSLKSKGINVSDHIDFKGTLNAVPELPYCVTEFEASGTFNLDNLEGLRNRQKLHCPPEKHLKRILFSLYPGNKTNRSLDEAATYVKLALDRDPLTWQVANMAALYWRIVGRPDYAMDCLRIAMEYADDDNKDIALLSTANVLFKSGYVSDAIVALTVFMEISPDSVIGHFAFGNVLAIKGEHRSALYHYQSAFDLQPNFLMALDRIRTLQCILGEHRVKPYRPGMH